jgi:hypothetical protein
MIARIFTSTYPALLQADTMDNYDSDSSAGDDVETNVLLGYASKEPTSDEFSQLGGHPVCAVSLEHRWTVRLTRYFRHGLTTRPLPRVN